MKRSILGLVVAVPVVILLASGFGHDPNATGTPLLNHPAPNFSLPSLGGGRISLASLRGKVVVLNFAASWCADCKTERPYLVSAWKRYARRGVTFIGITYHDSPTAARTFLRSEGMDWATLRDPGEQMAVAYGVTGVPETFVLDRRGILRQHFPGPVVDGRLAQQLGHLVKRAGA